jgi:hypothetical protein
MAWQDLFINNRALRRTRDTAQDMVSEQFNPNVMSPTISAFRQQATTGIGEGMRGQIRSDITSQLFRPQDPQMFGTQGQALAGSQAQSASGQQALAGAETQVGMMDFQARQQGAMGLAQAQTQAQQIGAQRRAGMQQAELQYQNELQMRRGGVTATALGIAGSVITTPFGGGDSLAGRFLENTFGEGQVPSAPRVPVAMDDPFTQELASAMDVDMQLPIDSSTLFGGVQPMEQPTQEIFGGGQRPVEVPSMLQRPPEQQQPLGITPDVNELIASFANRPEREKQMIDLFREYSEQVGLQISDSGVEQYPWDVSGGLSGLAGSFKNLWQSINPSEQERFQMWLQQRGQ